MRQISLLILFLILIFKISFSEYVLQVGAFKNRNNAENLTKELKEKGYFTRVVELGDEFYRVWVGSFLKEEEAKKEKEKMENLGYPVIVRKVEEKKIKEIYGKVEKKEIKPQKKEKITKKQLKPYQGFYSQILVETFYEHKQAENLRNQLSQKGYFSYILVEKNNYKVMVGQTLNESLQETFEKLKKEGYNPVFVP